MMQRTLVRQPDDAKNVHRMNSELALQNALDSVPWPESLHDRVVRCRLRVSDAFEKSRQQHAVQHSGLLLPPPQQDHTGSSIDAQQQERLWEQSIAALETEVLREVQRLAEALPKMVTEPHPALVKEAQRLLEKQLVAPAVGPTRRQALAALGGGASRPYSAGGASSSALQAEGSKGGGGGSPLLLQPSESGVLGAREGSAVTRALEQEVRSLHLQLHNAQTALKEQTVHVNAMKMFCVRKDSAVQYIRQSLLQDNVALREQLRQQTLDPQFISNYGTQLDCWKMLEGDDPSAGREEAVKQVRAELQAEMARLQQAHVAALRSKEEELRAAKQTITEAAKNASSSSSSALSTAKSGSIVEQFQALTAEVAKKDCLIAELTEELKHVQTELTISQQLTKHAQDQMNRADNDMDEAIVARERELSAQSDLIQQLESELRAAQEATGNLQREMDEKATLFVSSNEEAQTRENALVQQVETLTTKLTDLEQQLEQQQQETAELRLANTARPQGSAAFTLVPTGGGDEEHDVANLQDLVADEDGEEVNSDLAASLSHNSHSSNLASSQSLHRRLAAAAKPSAVTPPHTDLSKCTTIKQLSNQTALWAKRLRTISRDNNLTEGTPARQLMDDAEQLLEALVLQAERRDVECVRQANLLRQLQDQQQQQQHDDNSRSSGVVVPVLNTASLAMEDPLQPRLSVSRRSPSDAGMDDGNDDVNLTTAHHATALQPTSSRSMSHRSSVPATPHNQKPPPQQLPLDSAGGGGGEGAVPVVATLEAVDGDKVTPAEVPGRVRTLERRLLQQTTALDELRVENQVLKSELEVLRNGVTNAQTQQQPVADMAAVVRTLRAEVAQLEEERNQLLLEREAAVYRVPSTGADGVIPCAYNTGAGAPSSQVLFRGPNVAGGPPPPAQGLSLLAEATITMTTTVPTSRPTSAIKARIVADATNKNQSDALCSRAASALHQEPPSGGGGGVSLSPAASTVPRPASATAASKQKLQKKTSANTKPAKSSTPIQADQPSSLQAKHSAVLEAAGAQLTNDDDDDDDLRPFGDRDDLPRSAYTIQTSQGGELGFGLGDAKSPLTFGMTPLSRGMSVDRPPSCSPPMVAAPLVLEEGVLERSTQRLLQASAGGGGSSVGGGHELLSPQPLSTPQESKQQQYEKAAAIAEERVQLLAQDNVRLREELTVLKWQLDEAKLQQQPPTQQQQRKSSDDECHADVGIQVELSVLPVPIRREDSAPPQHSIADDELEPTPHNEAEENSKQGRTSKEFRCESREIQTENVPEVEVVPSPTKAVLTARSQVQIPTGEPSSQPSNEELRNDCNTTSNQSAAVAAPTKMFDAEGVMGVRKSQDNPYRVFSAHRQAVHSAGTSRSIVNVRPSSSSSASRGSHHVAPRHQNNSNAESSNPPTMFLLQGSDHHHHGSETKPTNRPVGSAPPSRVAHRLQQHVSQGLSDRTKAVRGASAGMHDWKPDSVASPFASDTPPQPMELRLSNGELSQRAVMHLRRLHSLPNERGVTLVRQPVDGESCHEASMSGHSAAAPVEALQTAAQIPPCEVEPPATVDCREHVTQVLLGGNGASSAVRGVKEKIHQNVNVSFFISKVLHRGTT